MRLKGKVAIVIGAGQSPGEGMGNGRATVLRFAQEGATVMAAGEIGDAIVVRAGVAVLVRRRGRAGPFGRHAFAPLVHEGRGFRSPEQL